MKFKIWHPSEQNHLCVPFMRDSDISSGCGNILDIPEGRRVNFGSRFRKIQRGGGHAENPFRMGGMDIFWNHTL